MRAGIFGGIFGLALTACGITVTDKPIQFFLLIILFAIGLSFGSD